MTFYTQRSRKALSSVSELQQVRNSRCTPQLFRSCPIKSRFQAWGIYWLLLLVIIWFPGATAFVVDWEEYESARQDPFLLQRSQKVAARQWDRCSPFPNRKNCYCWKDNQLGPENSGLRANEKSPKNVSTTFCNSPWKQTNEEKRNSFYAQSQVCQGGVLGCRFSFQGLPSQEHPASSLFFKQIENLYYPSKCYWLT